MVSLRFSAQELKELAVAWLMLSLAFTMILRVEAGAPFSALFLISLGTVATGFLFHELAHKVVAQHYGQWAEFRANFGMLVAALVMSFFGFLFAAPGAVVLGRTGPRGQLGRIALAGPAANLVMGGGFFLLSLMSVGAWPALLRHAGYVNAFLGLFNLIPFGFFDGAKILAWSRSVYAAAVVVGFVLVGLYVRQSL